MLDDNSVRSRRAILKSMGVLAGMAIAQGCARQGGIPLAVTTVPPPAPALPIAATPVPATAVAAPAAPAGVSPVLFDRARAAMDSHRSQIARSDMIAIADFGESSAERRFQFVHMESGTVSALHVTHGSGSDRGHSGRLQSFSNVNGSEATSEGAYVTDAYYVGQHGRSQRLIGLDPTNDNALARAIVIHGAWYANPDMLAAHGKLGRSQGCLAVAEADLARVFAMMGEGRMIYAGKA